MRFAPAVVFDLDGHLRELRAGGAVAVKPGVWRVGRVSGSG
jgi:hypothetical protein